ncbi:MAG TPA: 5'-methylthioadenosine/adenosylhomocysteine nucleosidase [Atopostipes sp.]|nr:5'-methylthioadenosine/adenosylhomocysteine nucleosidase [Atopostipes sp.]
MKIGILVAMEEEIKRLTEEIKESKTFEIAKQTFYDGKIHNQPVTVVQAGIGKVNATIATSLLIHEFDVDVVINTGSAGGVGAGLSIGELVVSTELTYNDVDNRGFGYTYGQIPQMPERYLTDETLRKMIERAAKKLDWFVQSGLIVTGDSFISSDEDIERIKEYFPEALVTEMEGAAVAQTCAQFDIPCAVIRAVSDTADQEATVDFDEFVLLAGQRSAELVMGLIEELGSDGL